MQSIFLLNRLRWYTRLPVKWAILGFTILAVSFPYPGLAYRHLQHWRNPNALIEPHAPALQPWVEELRPELLGDLPSREALKRVERFVYKKVKYEWDWITWGISDYLPTVTEVIEMGQEDCDGRAVVAASLLQNFGFRTQIVSDFSHVWVKTDKGETMGPGRRQAVVATERGLKVHWSALVELPRASLYGVAVFPLIRQLIVIVVTWWLMLRRNVGIVRSLAALALLCGGLMLLKVGGKDFVNPIRWMQVLGVLAQAAAICLLLFRNRGKAGTNSSSLPDSSSCAGVQGIPV